MVQTTFDADKSFSCRRSAWVLAFFFLLGLIAGTMAGTYADPDTFSRMRGGVRPYVSIVRLMMMLLLPFLISAAAFLLDAAFVFPICFCRAFLLGYVHSCLFRHLGISDWLLWALPDPLSVPLLYGFWSSLLSCRKDRWLNCIGCLVSIFWIGIGYFYIVMPCFGAF